MAHKIVKLKACELVEDFELYPRQTVFDGHVYDLAEAIRAGTSTMPPIVADEKSKRVTDGFHRRRAFLRVGGQDVEVDVMLVNYKDEAAMVEDSIRLNAKHGRRLTTADIAKCAALAKRFKISRENLAGILNITRERLKDITGTRMAYGKGDKAVVLRRPMVHLAGQKLTERQEQAVPHVGGQTAVYYANRLIELLEADALPPDDDNLIERLRILHGLLDGKLSAT